MTDETTSPDPAVTIAETVVNSLPIPSLVARLIDLFMPFLVSEAEKVFGKSVGGGVAAQNQDLTNSKYQWVLDCITDEIIPDLEKKCPSWEVVDIEALKPYVLQAVTAELNKLPAS